ncbi:MAG: ATP-dependent Clp protease ATP-binding subunit [Prevotellaceae bacterium]|jgi:ATP-dependent Clp protease ATP-binding subunit ClpC|nr:ATP-dependent Clp protease ATP-binding subunit [Prevotellaceae bacterium]
MNLKLSVEVSEIIHLSKEDAIRFGNKAISPDHFFLGIIRHGKNEALKLLLDLGVDITEYKVIIESNLSSTQEVSSSTDAGLYLTKASDKILRQIYLEARSMKEPEPKALHLLLAILGDNSSLITRKLADYGLTYHSMKSHLTGEPTFDPVNINGLDEDEEDEDPLLQKNTQTQTAAKINSDTPVIDTFSTDLTRSAAEGKLDPIVGREKEIQRIIQILSRRKKNNPVLIGDPGVGKSAIAEGLAMRILEKKVPRILLNKRIVALDLASIVAGTKYRGQFEERVKAILNEMQKHPEVILFIDEVHTMVGAGGASGSLDAANMLKPALARGDLQCIGATTLDEYREHIEKDAALERRFQKILIEPTSAEETEEILNNIKFKYEEHHHVMYTSEAIKACVKLSERYISDRSFPDKAIDALDEAGARVHIANVNVPTKITEIEKRIEEVKTEKKNAANFQNYEKAAELRNEERSLTENLKRAQLEWDKEMEQNRQIVDDDKVAEVIAMMTNVPVQRIAQNEGTRLIEMPTAIQGKVIGQEEAIEKVVRAIRRNRAGLKDPGKPIGTFIFLGPTGVGKTQLAKVLAQYLFDTSDNLIRIDMSEYMEKFAVSRLIGAPPGYVGYEEGGQLTEKVRRRPYSVLLLDEIEKAHPDVFHILLQLLDEGQLTDGLGRKVDFKNTIIIMTSNIGSRDLKEFGQGLGFATATNRERTIQANVRSIVEKALKRTFVPEFLNRIDEIVMFNPLDKNAIFKIIDIELEKLYGRLSEMGFKLELSDEAKNFIAEQGYDPQFGARPLKRSIQRHLEDTMAEAIIRDNAKAGDRLKADLNEEKKEIVVTAIKTAE